MGARGGKIVGELVSSGLLRRLEHGGGQREAAACADADHADPLPVDVPADSEVVDGGAEVLDEGLQGGDVARRAAALAVAGGIERQ
ncbi:hypothetical protein Q8Z05_17415 [Arthrobacter oryzae]|nr:hypothetical protein [Arthrobacter oryzae]WLQ05867.1 hypothetical protein Q8Z05_17415 [Arthrobacter oryzae]